MNHRRGTKASLRVRLSVVGAVGAVLLLIGAAAASAVVVLDGTSAPSISSDKADYSPGGAVKLTGAGWASGEVVNIIVNDTIGQSWRLESGLNGAPADPVADSGGGFTYSFNLPNTFVSDYDVTATGPISGTATTTFTDKDTYDWSQCKNDISGGSPLAGGTTNDNKLDPCQWVNGNLGATNSVYTEGDVVPQRAIRTVETVGPHSITLDHSFYNTSGNSYTYDFFATPDFTQKSPTGPENSLLAACNDVPTTGNFGDFSNAGCKTLLAAKSVVHLPIRVGMGHWARHTTFSHTRLLLRRTQLSTA